MIDKINKMIEKYDTLKYFSDTSKIIKDKEFYEMIKFFLNNILSDLEELKKLAEVKTDDEQINIAIDELNKFYAKMQPTEYANGYSVVKTFHFYDFQTLSKLAKDAIEMLIRKVKLLKKLAEEKK